MKIIHPPKLNIGDTVGVVSPSAPVVSKSHQQRSIRTLEKLGFKVVLGKNVQRSLGYMAGTPEERISDLHEMISNPKVKAIFTSAGGYVSQHLLRRLDYNLIKKNPKIICGFSDLTTLLNAIFKKTGLITFYNFSIQRFNEKATNFTIKSFMDMFVSDTPPNALPQRSHWRIIHRGRAKGRLVGGNLLTFTNNFNLKEYSPPLGQNKSKYILFFEEHDTDLEEMDNSLHRLGLLGVYNHLAGIIIGKITNVISRGRVQPIPTGDPEYQKQPRPQSLTLNRVLKRIFTEYHVHIPIVANVDFGNVRNRLSMPIGAMVDLNLNKPDQPTIKLLENPVRPVRDLKQ